MSEIIPYPHTGRVRWGLRAGHTTSSWGRLLSRSLTFLLPVLLPNIEPVARGPRAGDGSTGAPGLGPQRARPGGRDVGGGSLFSPPGALLGASGGRGQTASHLCFSLGRLTSLSSSPPACPPSVHMGFNVFITCLTRCLIASPLNGAVTVETRNKRPPENEMIKQVTLAKQTQPRNLWGVGRVGSSSPTHGWKAWTRLGTNVPVPELGQIQGGAPCWTVWHLACPFLRLPYLPGSPPGWPWALRSWAEGVARRKAWA